jgi:cysteinyl-tRNA synthetase
VAPFKEDPMDFVLWKPSNAQEPGWDSPWGRGRPGWHIECSAMSLELLGANFDIHGGGLDLQFPHHENEIAQSACAHPEAGFAGLWMHNEMLQVEGKKMSKSLGNFFTVRDLLDQGVPGEVIRFVYLMTHYRKPMNWTEEKAREAKATLKRWYILVSSVDASEEPPATFLRALGDDLNTSGAIAELHSMAHQECFRDLKASMSMLGLLEPGMGDWTKPPAVTDPIQLAIGRVLARWAQARRLENFVLADQIKTDARVVGVELVVDSNQLARVTFHRTALTTEEYTERLMQIAGNTPL